MNPTSVANCQSRFVVHPGRDRLEGYEKFKGIAIELRALFLADYEAW